MAVTTTRLRIVSAGGEYTAQLFAEGFPPPDADALATGTFTHADLDGEDGDPPFDALVQEWRDPNAAVARPQQIGERLYRGLDRAGVAASWLTLAAQATAKAPLRTFVETRGAASLLPWELTAIPDPDPDGKFADFVVFRPNCLFARIHKAPDRDDASRCMRVLIVTGGNILLPAKDKVPEVLAEPEIAAIVKAFQSCDWSVHIEALRSPADRNTLLATIRDVRPHILHFIGHGGPNPAGGGGGGALLFANQWAWDAQDIAADLNGQDYLRMVYLNACHSADAADNAAVVARAFMHVGSIAVVAMQAAVTVESAFELTRRFYATLADGEPIDRAMRDAREAVRGLAPAGGLGQRNWGLPSLSVSMPPERIITLSKYEEPLRSCEVRKELMVTLGPFVDRGEERRTVLRAFRPFIDTVQPERGLLIRDRGERNKSGKSWLLMRGLIELVHAGLEARVCDLSGKDAVSFRDVLTRFRHGWPEKSSPMYNPLPAADFVAFDQALTRFNDKIRRDGGQKNISDEEIKGLFDAFKVGLSNVARRSGLVLVFDNMTSASPDEFKGKITPLLLTPILNGDLPDVRVILVMSKTELKTYGVYDDEDVRQLNLTELYVEPFQDTVSRLLFDEFCRFNKGVTVDAMYTVFMNVYRDKGPLWSPAALGSMAQTVRDALAAARPR